MHTVRAIEAKTDAEVLATIVHQPMSKVTAALEAIGGFGALPTRPDAVLEAHFGPKGALAIRAAFDCARRFTSSADTRTQVSGPRDLEALLSPMLAHLPHERFVAVALNSRNVVLGHRVVAEGSVDQCSVDPRRVFQYLLSTNATAFALAHNHPSGHPEPSALDLSLTRQLKEAGQVLCLKLVDHLVIARDGVASMLARGLL